MLMDRLNLIMKLSSVRSEALLSFKNKPEIRWRDDVGFRSLLTHRRKHLTLATKHLKVFIVILLLKVSVCTCIWPVDFEDFVLQHRYNKYQDAKLQSVRRTDGCSFGNRHQFERLIHLQPTPDSVTCHSSFLPMWLVYWQVFVQTLWTHAQVQSNRLYADGRSPEDGSDPVWDNIC